MRLFPGFDRLYAFQRKGVERGFVAAEIEYPVGVDPLAVTRGEQGGDVYTIIYTRGVSERAKVFQNGGSQAVRLPKKFRFHDEEVIVRKVGKQVILEPADEWSSEFLACLGAWTEDIPRPRSRKIGRKKNPFDAA